MAALARPYPSADLAGGGAGCAAGRGAVDRCEGEAAGRRQAVGRGGSCLAANDDGLFAHGKEYGRCGRRVSWRGYTILAIDLEGTEVCDWPR